MAPVASQSPQSQIDRFCHQYLQLEPSLDFPPASILRQADVQEQLCQRLFTSDSDSNARLRFRPPVRYELRILKDLLARIENEIVDWDQDGVSDELASRLAHLVCSRVPSEMAAVQQRCYVSYYLSGLAATDESLSSTSTSISTSTSTSGEKPPNITLLESRALLSASGTTGLRTWEAALHLGQYLCANPGVVQGKHVLELGAGTGFLSILCAGHLGATRVVASDGAADVVAALPENFLLNGLQDSEKVCAVELWWGRDAVIDNDIGVVLGADITYDKEVIPLLVSTLRDLFARFPGTDVLISATQRNEETFRAFLEGCQTACFGVHDVEFEVPARAMQRGPFYDDKVNIRICRITSELDAGRD